MSIRFDFDDPDVVEDSQAPPLLYHYTDVAGFMGIVESQCLRATHHRFLNDLGEVRFGFKVVDEVLKGFQAQLGPGVVNRVERGIKELRNGDSFLACVSERHDVLSQWRVYASNGAGYCIGLRPEQRTVGYVGYDADDDNEPDSYINNLWKCRYGRTELEAILRKRIQRQIDRHATFDAEERAASLPEELTSLAWRYAHVAKHSHFKEEIEWRFVVSAPKSSIKYRGGRVGLTPYIDTEKLTIEKVWVGPGIGPNRDIAKRIATQLLSRHGITAEVKYWASPFVVR